MSQVGTRSVATPRSEGSVTLLSDVMVLVKPRISSFIVLAAFVGGLLATGTAASWPQALEASLWIGLVGASASAFNQVLERDTDSRMERTKGRPLPAGRLSVASVITFAATLAVTGTVALALRFGVLSALLALGTLVAYSLVYTPLKRHSALNTLVGAIPGAMPPLLGHAALAAPGQEVSGWGLAFFAVIFAWQFPHFMAIAWIYREDYARAELKMLPALPGSEGLAGRQAVLYALVLLPVSFLPVLQGHAGTVYAVGALIAGAAYLGASALFAWKESRRRARTLLLVSLVHLPALLACAVADPVVNLFDLS